MPSPSTVAAETDNYRKVGIIAKSGRPVAGTSPAVAFDFDAFSERFGSSRRGCPGVSAGARAQAFEFDPKS
jgi:hypothetical protein